MIPLLATARFPPPEFSETGHQLPHVFGAAARATSLELLDVAVLIVALALASWLSLHKRSRRGLVWLSLFSLAYFGFWRKGCICAIGSIQNVAQAVFDPTYALPLSVLAFCVAPLAFALLFGRSFCSSVCPHGALQDLMVLKPVRVPGWLERSLRLIAYAYLGLALIFAATGGGYIICQFDPFVPLFRLSGSPLMVGAGVALLALGLFVGRPYCRFLCPYGVLLGLASSVSKWRITITPTTCTNCRLCERACPFGAINPSSLDTPVRTIAPDRRRLVVLVALAPALIALGVWLGDRSGDVLARKHRTVALAERIHLEESGAVEGTTDASVAFRGTGEPVGDLFKQAVTIAQRYHLAGRLGGAWIGLVIAAQLIASAVRRRRAGYEADRLACVSCARCFRFCPQDPQSRIPVPAPGEATLLSPSVDTSARGNRPA